MNEVKVSFSKQTWSGDGTYYRGCYTIDEDLFTQFKNYVNNYLEKYKNRNRFSSDEMRKISYLPSLNIELEPFTGKKVVFLKLTQRDKFITFLKEVEININLNRAFGQFNYYFEIK